MIENDIGTGKIALLIFVETKKGWLVRLGQEVVAWGWVNGLKYLKRGGTEKRGGETKVLKMGDMLGQGKGALKSG